MKWDNTVITLRMFIDYTWSIALCHYCSFIAHNTVHAMLGCQVLSNGVTEPMDRYQPVHWKTQLERTDSQNWVGLPITTLLPSRCRAPSSNPRLPGRQRTNQTADQSGSGPIRQRTTGNTFPERRERERDGKFGELPQFKLEQMNRWKQETVRNNNSVLIINIVSTCTLKCI